VGIPLIAIDGRPTCDAPDPITQCPFVRDTARAGGALTAVGVVGLAAAGVFIYLDLRRPREPSSRADGPSGRPRETRAERPRLQIQPAAGGALLGASYRF
jgi:hypothetical protein